MTVIDLAFGVALGILMAAGICIVGSVFILGVVAIVAGIFRGIAKLWRVCTS
jgi:hypothetical protein